MPEGARPGRCPRPLLQRRWSLRKGTTVPLESPGVVVVVSNSPETMSATGGSSKACEKRLPPFARSL